MVKDKHTDKTKEAAHVFLKNTEKRDNAKVTYTDNGMDIYSYTLSYTYHTYNYMCTYEDSDRTIDRDS